MSQKSNHCVREESPGTGLYIQYMYVYVAMYVPSEKIHSVWMWAHTLPF